MNLYGTKTYFEVRLGNVLMEFMENPAKNLSNAAIVKVTFQRQPQIFLNTPRSRRENKQLLQHINCHTPSDQRLVKLPPLLNEFLCAFSWWEWKTSSFMSVRMFVPISTSLSGLVKVKCYVIVRSGTYTIRVNNLFRT